MVATGDSYSSGEGIPGTGPCAQSNLAYGPLTRDKLKGHISSFAFTACTGHLAEDLFNARPGVNKGSLWNWAAEQGVSGRPDIVTLSFGGNDIGFADVLLDCLGAPQSWMSASGEDAAAKRRASKFLGELREGLDLGCDTPEDELLGRIAALEHANGNDGCRAGRGKSRWREEEWSCSLLIVGAPGEDGQVRGNLADFYAHIVRERMSPRGHLFVVAYPSLFAPTTEWPGILKLSCQGVLKDDAERLMRASEELNTTLARSVRKANAALGQDRVHFVYITANYRTAQAELCGTGTDWINGVDVTKGSHLVTFWSGSFHPNRLGHAASAETVSKRIHNTDWSLSAQSLFDSATSLVIDTSYSMSEPAGNGTSTKLDAAKSAAEAVLGLVESRAKMAADPSAPLASGSHVIGVVEFSTQAAPVSGPSSDVSLARSSVSGLSPREDTNIGEGLVTGIEQLAGTAGAKAIVLLSDGQTNRGLASADILGTLVPRAAAADIKVFTIGFGEPGTLDEPLLRGIASGTGGVYSFATTPTALQQSFIEARARTAGDVQLSRLSAIAQDQVETVGPFTVAAGLGELEVALTWPGSDLDIILRDPRGRLVDDEYEGAHIVRSNPEVVVVTEPVDGEWQLDVKGVDVPGPTEEYAVVASTRGTAPPKPKGSAAAVGILLAVLAMAGGTGTTLATRTRRRARSCASCAKPLAVGARACDHCGVPVAPFLTLRVVGGPEEGLLLHVAAGEVIGREDAHHALRDETVSRRHARIDWEQDSWVIVDLNSTSGTLRNHEPVLQARLRDGDLLTLGESLLVVQDGFARDDAASGGRG